MRLIENFNQDWFFSPNKLELSAPKEAFEPITLPHSNTTYSERFVDNQSYQFISTYRKFFNKGDWQGKRVFLDFDGVMLEATVYLNEHCLGVHQGGYTGFSFELTPYLKEGENQLTVYVDSRERPDIPPYGNLVDYLSFGGIYRDVHLRIVNESHIASAYIHTSNVLKKRPDMEAAIELSQWQEGQWLEVILEELNSGQVPQIKNPALTTVPFVQLDGIQLWSLENPALYHLRINLWQGEELLDSLRLRFGFREAYFKDGSFYLNGKAIKLFGLNRHQTYPYIGAAAPKRLQELDAEILKYELGCNIVRTSHYAQSPHFLNRCDEIGLLVFEELAGWQHIGDENWQCLVQEDLAAMIKRDRHHPAIILWGVRVNESPDNHAFYTQTNKLAHELDPSRQTGGVRNFISSEFLEDVFTLNDFPEGIQNPTVQPHLITEFAGHMFPTKSFDHEERRLEHALHHARKHNLQMGHSQVSGAIAWCAFDYHTHKEFGSGDRICHHGVMDIFRLPKFAAFFYRSQKSPQDEIVLQAATHWTMGDRSAGGNNPLTIFSNCEAIEVFIGELSQGRFQPDRASFPHLPHPPFTVQWPEPYNPWGYGFEDLHIQGYIAGKLVVEQRISAEHLPHRLRLSANTKTLKADGADMARIVVQVLDKYDNVLPYQFKLVHFELEGAAELVGENPLLLLGGQAAIYLKAHHKAGHVKVKAQALNLPVVEIDFEMEH